jgi:hypothetical protein
VQVCDAILPIGPGNGGLHADRESYFEALAAESSYPNHEPARFSTADSIAAASILDHT